MKEKIEAPFVLPLLAIFLLWYGRNGLLGKHPRKWGGTKISYGLLIVSGILCLVFTVLNLLDVQGAENLLPVCVILSALSAYIMGNNPSKRAE
jgi:hypothetical protein